METTTEDNAGNTDNTYTQEELEAISAAEDEYGCSAADVRYFEQTTEVPEEQPHSPQALGN